MDQCPQDLVPEVVVLGRSNAVKSSIINALARQIVAKVSQQPGKTRLLNFFQAGENIIDGWTCPDTGLLKSVQKSKELARTH
ncbi:MAG: GTPase [Bdellovibrionales bacterium]